jgi:two-component system, cell cycle response regulator DivK
MSQLATLRKILSCRKLAVGTNHTVQRALRRSTDASSRLNRVPFAADSLNLSVLWSLDVNLPVMTRLSKPKPTILAVDDNLDNLVLLEYQLQDLLDCSLMKASCGYDALAQIEARIPDLLLLDIVLPDINGMEITRRLRSRPETLDLPIIAVTASARLEDRRQILDSGCTDYLSKPYDINDLENLIHLHLKAYPRL